MYKRQIEILPTFTTIQYGELDTTQPIFTNQNPDPDAGVNLKYGLTSNLTADFTVNPDFSQIESDRPQIEVNQRYPLFFSELRPFFVEGSEIFNVTAPVTLVHTRTMVDPDYGAKLTGQVGRFTLGALGANDRAPGRVDDQTSSAFGQTAKTFIGRAKFDLYSESHIGAMVTDREFLDGYSRLAGLDSNFRLGSVTRLAVNAFGTNRQQPGSSEDTGNFLGTFLSSSGRNLNASVLAYQISPDFHTDVGFVRRRDQRNTQANIGYRFWPEGQLINWGPSVSYGRNYDFDGILQDETKSARMSFSFARSISLYGNVNYDMERWSQIDFQKSRFGIGGRANPSRSYSFGGNFSVGNEIFYSEAFLGHQVNWSVNGSVRPTDALQTNLNFSHRRFTDPTNNDEVKFDVKIIRAQSTFQFTDRLGLRNITEWNTEDRTFDFNMLFNYTVNAGTVFYVGYDDHYQQGDLLRGDTNSDGFLEQLYWTKQLQRTNRAIFMKFQYLFRY